MKIKLLIVLNFFILNTYAQIPGFMGKRFSVGYSNYLMVAGVGPSANAAEKDAYFSGINTTHCLNLEYTIRNRTNFCFTFETMKTGVSYTKVYNSYVYDNNTSTSYNVSYAYSPKPYIPMQVRTFNVGLGFKFFRRGTLAPIGKYNKLELLMLFSKLTYGNTSFALTLAGTTNQGMKGTGDYNFSTFGVAYTTGRSRVLFNKLVIDYGLRLGLVPAGIFASDLFFGSDNGSGREDFEKSLRQQTNIRLFREQLVNFHIGLGFLAF